MIFRRKQLTDGATDGPHRVWDKDCFSVRRGSGCRRLLPPNPTGTVDLQHLGQIRVRVRVRATRGRGAVKVTPRLRSPRPGLSGHCAAPLLPHRLGQPEMPKRLKERRIPAAHRCPRPVTACEQPRAQCQPGRGARACEAKSCFPPPPRR